MNRLRRSQQAACGAAWHKPKEHSTRTAASLLEVIAGLTLMTLLLVPMIGIMSASVRVWRQFESGHDAVAIRQSAMTTLTGRLQDAVDVVSVANRSIRVRSSSGEIQRFFQSGSQLICQRGSVREVLAEGIGTLEFRSLPTGLSPQSGHLIQVRLNNMQSNRAAVGTAGPSTFNSVSMAAIWVRSPI